MILASGRYYLLVLRFSAEALPDAPALSRNLAACVAGRLGAVDFQALEYEAEASETTAALRDESLREIGQDAAERPSPGASEFLIPDAGLEATVAEPRTEEELTPEPAETVGAQVDVVEPEELGWDDKPLEKPAESSAELWATG
jgi:hypothetical protein